MIFSKLSVELLALKRALMGREEEPFQLREEKVPETISPHPWSDLQSTNR